MQSKEIEAHDLEGIPPLNTTVKAARLLRRSRRHISRLIASGKLPALKLGRGKGCRVLITRLAIAAFLACRHFVTPIRPCCPKESFLCS